MKKPTLQLRRETLRVIGQLDLARVPGGNPDAPQIDTGGPGTGCPYIPAATLPPK